MLLLDILGLQFEIDIIIFEISTLKFVLFQNFAFRKSLNVGPKMLDLGIFGLQVENNIFIFKISTLKVA